ncbi:MAG: proline--tRNA ligase, partial [Spirochaetaceae bacterium]|nr:proline--tRNA ligase [Spirochaetaceae bacterium]
EEMDRIGGQELSLPVVHPADLWQATGRWHQVDATLARFRDRRARDLVLAMTHEEAVAFHAASEITSYRQLPALVYQVQTKFRDELRPRGGLIRVREFRMKDSYSLDRDQAGLERQYRAHYEAYGRIGRRVGVPLTAVRSDTGMMGGAVAHEFMYLTPAGEDSLALCDKCGYAANRDIAEFALQPAAAEPAALEEVHTPGTATIGDLAAYLDIAPQQTAKMVFYAAAATDAGGAGDASGTGAEHVMVVAAIVRGDLEVNPIQVQNLAGVGELRPAHDEEIAATGMVPGFASPVGIDPGAAIFVVDRQVAESTNLVMGANRTDYHLRNVCCGRDYQPTVVGPVAAAFDGAPCASCGNPLRLARGVEVGNIFQLGTRYSDALEARFTDEAGSAHPVVMGSYGIGLERLLACVAEEHRDEHGLLLPVSVAPYQVALVALARKEETWQAAERVFADLVAAGIEVLYDDRRGLSAGVKFNDADLRGLPLRVVVGERSLAAGGAELSHRGRRDRRTVPLNALPDTLHEEIAALHAPFTFAP